MTTRLLAWFISGMLALAFLAFALMTVAPIPEVERGFSIAQALFATGCLAFAVLGLISGRLPAQHWLNRSRALRGILLLLSLVVACALFLGVIG